MTINGTADREQIALDDRYDFIEWIRWVNPLQAIPNPDDSWGLKEGKPDIKSAASLAFGPDGVLFVADTKGAAIFALDTGDTDVYVVVLAEMMDIDAGHISLASPLGRALANGRVGDEISLRLPTATRRLRITELVTVHQAEGNGNGKRRAE